MRAETIFQLIMHDKILSSPPFTLFYEAEIAAAAAEASFHFELFTNGQNRFCAFVNFECFSLAASVFAEK
jgi:hypothetical protein